MVIKTFSASILLLIFIGCSDDSISTVHNKKILDKEIECMRLLVFPPNEKIESTLKSLYNFKNDCDLDFIVSYKNSITCNSNQNIDKKAYGMPKGYVRYEIKSENKLFYSYYIDLDEDITKRDIKSGFERVKKALTFK
ncbi:MAG: hypothetical protein OQJ77_06625 [Thiovulaceae bacterium]|nr:hypothetical protein [Sulfurimonadaceae bacterium]MCW9026975.1 hypothetical protein [Sulfurimonadaceae bacterium]